MQSVGSVPWECPSILGGLLRAMKPVSRPQWNDGCGADSGLSQGGLCWGRSPPESAIGVLQSDDRFGEAARPRSTATMGAKRTFVSELGITHPLPGGVPVCQRAAGKPLFCQCLLPAGMASPGPQMGVPGAFAAFLWKVFPKPQDQVPGWRIARRRKQLSEVRHFGRQSRLSRHPQPARDVFRILKKVTGPASWYTAAAWRGRLRAVRRLLARGAEPH
jgi:hypothetical protein